MDCRVRELFRHSGVSCAGKCRVALQRGALRIPSVGVTWMSLVFREALQLHALSGQGKRGCTRPMVRGSEGQKQKGEATKPRKNK
jgi:hypothetical protein